MKKRNGALSHVKDRDIKLLKKNPDKFWKGVEFIDDNAFRSCTSLTNIVIPESVKGIGSYAFSNCYFLNEIVLPKSVKTIGDGAFNECPNLTKINIPDCVKEIGVNTFCNCISLSDIVITNGLTKINDNAFCNCPKLKEFNIPNGLTEIGEGAFAFCSSLKEITIPEGVKNIKKSTFVQCLNLKQVNLPKGLTSIDRNAFARCIKLVDIAIPEEVCDIGDFAFEGCSALTKVVLPNSIKHIGERVFSKCSKLEEVNLKTGIEEVSKCAFEKCTCLKKINLQRGLLKINKGAFTDCTSLTEILIPEGLEEIESEAFKGCTNLTNLSLSKDLKNIGEKAFSQCSKLVEVIIPDGVEEIGDFAFDECSSLKKLTIPRSLTKLREKMFKGIPSSLEISYYDINIRKNIFSLYEQCSEVFNSPEDLDLVEKLISNYINIRWLDDFQDDEIKNFNPKLWKKLIDNITKISLKEVNIANYEDLFRLARNLGLFDDAQTITIKNGQGKDVQVHVNEMAFNFLQKFTKDINISKMHMLLHAMVNYGQNEEFLKFISNKVNYDEMITELEKNYSTLTNIYLWFKKREKLTGLTGIERDDNLTNNPTSENNRYKIRTYETGENGIDKTKWKAPTVRLIIKDLNNRKFVGAKTSRERVIADNLKEIVDYQQNHFEKAIEIDRERKKMKIPDFIVGKHIGQNRTQAFMEYTSQTGLLKKAIFNEAGEIINNQVDISNKIFTYDTLAKSDIANFSIGFMTSCCARLYGAGAGAMRASILHKDIQPLVVRNDKDEIVAYSILYINRKEGYAVLNDIEVNTKYSGQEEQLKIIYEKMRRGAIENIEEYNKTTKVPITKLNCGITPNWDAVNEYIKKNPESSILKAPNFDDFKYAGSGSWKGDWHKGQWTIWEEDGNERL